MKPHKGDNSRPPDARRRFLNTTEYERISDEEYRKLLQFCAKHNLICLEYHRRHPETLVKRQTKGFRREWTRQGGSRNV